MIVPAPKRDEPHRHRQYAPKDQTRKVRYKVSAMLPHHEWADTDECVAESRWHTLTIEGDHENLAGVTVDRNVVIKLPDEEIRVTVPIPLDRDQVIVPVTLWPAWDERKAKRSAEWQHARAVKRAELERSSRVTLMPVRDLIPRLG